MPLEALATALFAALTYALTGYFKTPNQVFDWTKFFVTIILGLLIGGAYFILESAGVVVTQDLLFVYASQVGATAVLEQILKGLWKRVPQETVTPPAA